MGLKYEIISSDDVVNTCSTSCAEAAWESSHSLLCTGEKSDPAHREALLKFIKHANGKAPSLRKPIIFNNLNLFWIILFCALLIYLIVILFLFSPRNKWYILTCCKGEISFWPEFLLSSVLPEKYVCTNTQSHIHAVNACISDIGL